MSDDQPSLQIDTDWKKQAQEEKRKLAERTQQPAAAPAAPGLLTPGSGAAAATGAAPAAGATTAPPGAGGREGRGGRRELPQAGMSSLVNSLLTQVLLYLGEIATASGPMVDLDRARHQLDTLAVLEEKTKNNLTEDEQKQLDSALYEARMRFVNVASQYL